MSKQVSKFILSVFVHNIQITTLQIKKKITAQLQIKRVMNKYSIGLRFLFQCQFQYFL